MSTARTLGLVHTVPTLGPTFHDLLLQLAETSGTSVEPIHITDPWLLHTAMTAGVTPDVLRRLSSHVEHLHRQGVAGVLVTCSSVGEAVEEVATRLGAGKPPVFRIDQGMADRAVALAGSGGRIAVLATVDSTIDPTARLITRSAEHAGTDVRIEAQVLAAAGQARVSGNDDRHDDLVRRAVIQWATPERADVVLLAQASMAHVADSRLTETDVPVLSSPRLAVEHLLTHATASPPMIGNG